MKHSKILAFTSILVAIAMLWSRSDSIYDQISIGNFENEESYLIHEKRTKNFPVWPPKISSFGAFTIFSFKGIVYIRYELLKPERLSKQSMKGWRSDNNQISTFSYTKQVTYHSANGGEWHIFGFTFPYHCPCSGDPCRLPGT